MATTTGADTRLTALALPSIPESVPAARWHVRDALRSHGLGEFAEDAAAITSELVTNTVQHARDNGTTEIGVTLSASGSRAAVTITVSDSSPHGPIKRDTPAASEQGRGLQIVEALSAHWGWRPQDGGKAVFAVLAREA